MTTTEQDTVLTKKQRRRVEALESARKVIEYRQPKGPLTASGSGIEDVGHLLVVAEYIVGGTFEFNYTAGDDEVGDDEVEA